MSNQADNQGALKKILKGLLKTEDFLIVTFFALMIIVCFLQVLFRYIFHYSAPWTDELGRYFMIYLIMIGAGWVVHDNSHIRLDVIDLMVKNKKTRAILDLIIYVVLIIFCVFFTYSAMIYIPQIISSGERTIALRMPMWIAQFSILIGAILMLVHYVELFFVKLSALRRGEY